MVGTCGMGFVSCGEKAESSESSVEEEKAPWSLEDGVLEVNENYEYNESCNTPWSSEAEDIKEVIIGDKVTDTSCICCDCTNLTSVTMSDKLKEIGVCAFEGCTSLTSVTIPDSVTKIHGSFSYCSGLTEVTIPESVKEISRSSFGSCENLEKITILNPDCEIYDDEYTISNGIDENNNPYFNGTIYGYEGSTAQTYAENCGYNFEAIE